MNKKNHILCSLISIIVSQSGHNFAHAMTAELSWHVQNCDLTGSYFVYFVRLQDLVYELINSLWNGSLDIDWSVSSNVNFQENVSHECIVNMWAYVHSQCSKYFDVFKHDWLGSFYLDFHLFYYLWYISRIFESACYISTHILRTFRSTSIWHWSGSSVSDQCQINIYQYLSKGLCYPYWQIRVALLRCKTLYL